VPEPVPVTLTRIHHVGIAVTDLDAAIERYQSAFPLVVAAIETNDEQGVREAMLQLNPADADGLAPSYLQLLTPLHADTPVGKFLSTRGEGVHHIGYAVESVTVAIETLTAQGFRVLDAVPRHGSLGAAIAFVHPKDLHGVLTELVEPARG
jgi:methylmalonyl-CoA/ethylmalonyl-CoA epimerase